MNILPRTLRRTSSRRVAAVGVVAVGALLLSACGGDDSSDTDSHDMSGMHHGSASASASASAGAGGFNDADVMFAQAMIPHHEQAVEMARLAGGRASDAKVKSLAAKIEQAQDPEINTMKGWLKAWNKPTAMPSMPGTDHRSGMDGMMSGKDMDELKALKGKQFDKMFARMMIQHHDGAITMARTERRNGTDPGAVKMAGDIVTSQSAEVEQLRAIVDRL
jgi:uncharacterized protein (DUF305 family)